MAKDPSEIVIYRNNNTNEYLNIYGENLPQINNISDISGEYQNIDWSWTGHNFIGWNTNSNGTGTFYYPGSSYVDGDLYAIWEQDISIHFKSGTYNEYISADKDDNTLYFIPDKGIYKGSQQIVSIGNDLVGISHTNSSVGGVYYYQHYLDDKDYNNNSPILITINNNQISASANPNIFNWINDCAIDIDEIPAPSSTCGFTVNGNTLTIINSNQLSDESINDNDYLMVGCTASNDEEMLDFIDSIASNESTYSIDFRFFNDTSENIGADNVLAICLTDGNNHYYIPLNKNLFNYIKWGLLQDPDSSSGNDYYCIPVIHKNYINGVFNILNEDLYGLCYREYTLYFLGSFFNAGTMLQTFWTEIFLDNYEDRIILDIKDIHNSDFKYPGGE